MYNNELLESKQAPSLAPQVWACDCAFEGRFKEVRVTNGQCINCNHYAKRIGTFELARNEGNAYMGPVDSKNRTCADLRKEGHTLQQIANLLNISTVTVTKWIQAKPRKSRERKINPLQEKIIALRLRGRTYKEIAQYLGVSYSSAYKLGDKK